MSLISFASLDTNKYSYTTGSGKTTAPNLFSPTNNNVTNYAFPNNNIFSGYKTNQTNKTSQSYKTNLNKTYSLSDVAKLPTKLSSNLGMSIAQNAQRYLGFNEKDGSYLRFGERGAWCVAFSTYVTKEALKRNGKTPPSWLNTHSVQTLMDNANRNNSFLKTSGSSNKASLIAKNVKPGDTVIFKKGRSHAGIVTKVYADGSFDTIEGNTKGDKVATRHYSANERTLSGFVQVPA